MYKFNLRLNLRQRVVARCPRHPRYNPETHGRGAIIGNCSTCYELHDLHQARLKLDHAIKEFTRRAAPWEPQTRRTPKLPPPAPPPPTNNND